VAARGGLGGIALTHRHADHDEAVEPVREGTDAPVAAGDGPADVRLEDGVAVGPLVPLATPGHAPGHFAFRVGTTVALTGDAVLGEGSVFVAEQLAAYLAALRRLRALPLERICPGHGPEVTDPATHLDGYLAHRAERERRLIAALEAGARTEGELLDAAWSDAPTALRPAAAFSLRAHLGKLDEEGRLPSGVERAG
jgi:glyoxylase-like metal-dependent hydrolase (beta-lactamase superfamily II)